ncbi:Uncharacterised protein [Vibrio cholerae]|nr:Uncharacterised protein [Vibrio cholerae]
MTPTTPRGTRRRANDMPFSNTRLSISLPTGSFNLITLRTSLAIACKRDSLSSKRSSMASDKPASRPSAISFAFAARMLALCASN